MLFTFPVNATALNATMRAAVKSVYPVVGTLPRATANFSAEVVDPTGLVLTARHRGPDSPESSFVFELDEFASLGDYALRLWFYGGSDGQSAGDHYAAEIFVDYPAWT